MLRVRQKAAADTVCPDHQPQIGKLAPKQELDGNYGRVKSIKGNTNTTLGVAGAKTSMPQRDKAPSAVPGNVLLKRPNGTLMFL